MPDTALTDNVSYFTSAFYDPNIRQQVVTQCTSATRPTGVEGRLIAETDTNLIMVHNGTTWVPFGSFGTWTTHTPQIDQGASTNIAKTVTYSRYIRQGSSVTWSFDLAMTAAGTAGSVVTLTLPVAAAVAAGVRGGSGLLYDSNTTTSYGGSWIGITTTQIALRGDWSTTTSWGATPNLALASADGINGSITYEAAS